MKLSGDSCGDQVHAPLKTMLHAFINCPTVKEFWKKIEDWLQNTVDPHIKLGDTEITFGWDSPGNITSSHHCNNSNHVSKEATHLLDVRLLLSNQMMLEE